MLFPDEVTPRRWESTPPLLCLRDFSPVGKSIQGVFRIWLKVLDFRHKAVSSGAVGESPKPGTPVPPKAWSGLDSSPQKGHRACHSFPCQAVGQGDWTENLTTSKLTLAGARVLEPQPHPHVGALSLTSGSLQAQ